MFFDLKTSSQSQTIEHHFKAALYQKLHDASKKTRIIRLTGFGVGIVSSFISIATRVALIGENMLKGAGNVFGSPFFKKCELKTGLMQLFAHTSKNVFLLPFSIFAVVFNISTKTVYVGFDSINYTRKLWFSHTPELKKRMDIEAEKEKFQKFSELIVSEPENLDALKFLSNAYNRGIGEVVQKNETKSLELYKKAAQLGSTYSMDMVGLYYLKHKDGTQAYEWFKKSADLNDAGGIYLVGYCLYFGIGVEKDQIEAAKFRKDAAKKGCKLDHF